MALLLTCKCQSCKPFVVHEFLLLGLIFVQASTTRITFPSSSALSMRRYLEHLHLPDLVSHEQQVFYPINNTDIGGGTLHGLDIKSRAQTNFTLPFTLNYTFAIDPQFQILDDLIGKCGFTGSAASQLKVNYEIDVSIVKCIASSSALTRTKQLDFKVLFVPIKPKIKNSASFACPISASDISVSCRACLLVFRSSHCLAVIAEGGWH